MSEVASKEVITKQVEEEAKKHYGSMFSFRPHQKEAIVECIYDWLNGVTKDVILQGPTGSGKSVVALLVSSVLSDYYDKTGYIVISDLSLIEQYERDVQKYFSDWSVIKGQQNYTCNINGLPFTAGECKLKGCKSYYDIMRKFPECSETCQYIIERRTAMNAKVLVCTYSFWLVQRNIVGRKMGDNAPFGKRDFVIYDEAHKLVSVVQSHFSPRFSDNDINKFQLVLEFGSPDDSSVINDIEGIRRMIAESDNNDRILELLVSYVKKINIVCDAAETCMRDIQERLDAGERVNKEDKNVAYACDFVKEHHNSFSEYISIISSIGTHNLVKNPQTGSSIIFNCVDESYLMGKYFHEQCNYKLYMSATIGSRESFARDAAIGNNVWIDMPSTFDFKNSPIIYVDNYKLSYKEKEYTLPKIIELVSKIAKMYNGSRGIIQTGSYEFAKKLYELCDNETRDRLVLYGDSDEKKEAMMIFRSVGNKILVGPTLIEGLSFDDELCRFQIIMKVPYPSLSDKFVNVKQQVKPEWYTNTTAISILQGVGRGIRNANDWCVTFILDGCFTSLYQRTYDSFPDDFKNRVMLIKAETLLSY